MTDSMVSRVAAGIWGRWIRGRLVPEQWRGVTWEELNRLAEINPRARELVEAAHDEARGAIEAMRNPTDVMVSAGEECMYEHHEGPRDWCLENTREAWGAMIDAALNE